MTVKNSCWIPHDFLVQVWKDSWAEVRVVQISLLFCKIVLRILQNRVSSRTLHPSATLSVGESLHKESSVPYTKNADMIILSRRWKLRKEIWPSCFMEAGFHCTPKLQIHSRKLDSGWSPYLHPARWAFKNLHCQWYHQLTHVNGAPLFSLRWLPYAILPPPKLSFKLRNMKQLLSAYWWSILSSAPEPLSPSLLSHNDNNRPTISPSWNKLLNPLMVLTQKIPPKNEIP